MGKYTKEDIEHFLKGTDPMEHIIKIECGYNDNEVTIYYRDNEGKKQIMKDDFHPFCWCKKDAAQRLYNGNRTLVRSKLAEYGISCKLLRTTKDDGTEPERMRDGYKILFYANRKMSFSKFMEFFEKGDVPIYPKPKHKEYGLENYVVSKPIEQYMILTGRRQFKGYKDYDDLLRFVYDLETEGLDPKVHAISQIGCSTNKGYKKIIKVEGEGEERRKNEVSAIREFFYTIKEIDPDVITGHNIENFDFYFIDVRLQELLGIDMLEFTKGIINGGVKKLTKRSVLKLGGETEYFFPTVMKGVHITDSLFAVRRSQAQDSNMERADLKYVTRYSKLNKENRVYVPGRIINDVWADELERYAFNENDGDWYEYDISKSNTNEFKKGLDENGKFHLYKRNYIEEGYKLVSGRYIVERYLMDDLYEADRVEHKFNNTSYFLAGILPVSYDKIYTMGTAAIWKNIMLAWSYQESLAIPKTIQPKSFTGGLSRTMTTGMLATASGSDLEEKEFGYKSVTIDEREVYKYDLNSLYPSIILTWNIKSEVDITDALPMFLNYVLTEREYFKGLKKKYGKLAEEEKLILIKLKPGTKEYNDTYTKWQELYAEYLFNDSSQLLLKLVGNSYFGSFGACRNIFYWSDLKAAEKVTCIGRMVFRLLCYHFNNLHRMKPQWMR